jgi:hypothetical protein
LHAPATTLADGFPVGLSIRTHPGARFLFVELMQRF